MHYISSKRGKFTREAEVRSKGGRASIDGAVGGRLPSSPPGPLPSLCSSAGPAAVWLEGERPNLRGKGVTEESLRGG